MASTIIWPGNTSYPKIFFAPVVQIKPSWSAGWFWVPELELLVAQAVTAGRGIDSCTLQRRYGYVKQPWEPAINLKGAWPDLTNWWVRLMMVGQWGWQQAWIGRVGGVLHEPHRAQTPSGLQSWQAYGPKQILNKIAVSRSFWYDGSNQREIGWVPGINDRDDRGTLLGNRSAAVSGNSYCYGGTGVWTHYDYLQYLLDRFVDESAAGGPAWSIGGQPDLLDNLSEVIPMRDTQTVAEIIAQLIPVKYGMDYTIVPAAAGFEINVYSLSATAYSFGTATLPSNPNTVQIRTAGALDNISTTVGSTADHAYSRVRILGAPIVICCSLRGANVPAPPAAGTLVPKWSDALEAAYDAASDEDRQKEEYRPVYQFYGAAAGVALHTMQAVPKVNAQNQLVAGGPFDFQDSVRQTLSWTPLREGFDYSTDPAGDNNPADFQPELLPPLVLIANAVPDDYGDLPDDARYVSAETEGISISIPPSDWGVFLSASPNHLLALDDFVGAATAEVQPKYNWKNMVATLAFRGDHRLMLTAELPSGATPSGGTLDVEVPEAELWYLAPHTVVADNSAAAHLGLKDSGPTARILRNDYARLEYVMAGVLARYENQRARAQIRLKGLFPWTGLLGQILTVVDSGGTVQMMEAVISSIAWGMGKSPTTTISTGFAQ